MSKHLHHIYPRRELVRFTDRTGHRYRFARDRASKGIEYRNPRSVMRKRATTGWKSLTLANHHSNLYNSLKIERIRSCSALTGPKLGPITSGGPA